VPATQTSGTCRRGSKILAVSRRCLLSATAPEDARAALAARGIPMDEERLVRAVQTGDRDAVRLLLAAGVLARTRTAAGEPAVVVAARHRHFEIVADLLAAGADAGDLARAIAERRPAKDFWEKLAALSGVLTFTSSLVIAGVGWYFTRSYNDRQAEAQRLQNVQQNRLVEMQTIERLIPHLIKDEQSKRAALIAINELASPTLAIQIAAAFGGTGAVEALGSIAIQGGPSAGEAVSGLAGIASRGSAEERRAVESALGRVFARVRDSVVTVFVDGGARCTGFVVGGGAATVLTAEYCVPADARAVHVGSDSRRYPASVVGRDEAAGTVSLSVPDLSAPALALAGGPPQIGTPVTAVGAIGEARAYPGVTTAVDVDAGSMAVGLSGFNATGLVEVRFEATDERGGSGGGPILDRNGSVVCMVYLGSQSTDYCVPAMRLRAAAGR
jgi:hypothetical protein